MKKFYLAISLLCIIYLWINYRADSKIPNYYTIPQVSILPNEIVDEASGICDSRTNPGNIWIHNDGGNINDLYLFSHQGHYKGAIRLPFPNRDWEDIAITTDDDNRETYIYLADIGDNLAVHPEYYIYRFKEPKLNQHVGKFDRITFQYPDGKHDAEAMLIDPRNNDIYIITKRELNVKLYKLAYPQDYTKTLKAEYIQDIPYFFITSGGISTDGREIVLRNYGVFYYWYRKRRESIPEVLSRGHDRILPFVRGYQEEGFCFDKRGNGFFSIGERIIESSDADFAYFKKETSTDF